MADAWGIYFIDLGVPIGHEQGYERPAILVRSIHNVGIILPLTTRTDDLNRFSYTLRINRGANNKLTADSVALLFQIRAIDARRIGRNMGNLDRMQIEIIKTQLKDLLNPE